MFRRDGEGESEIWGLVKGTPIQITGRAPLYDPVAIKVRDYTLTLRNNEADFIKVEVDDGEKE